MRCADCIVSHGAASFLRERLLLVSDAYRVHVCERCGMIAAADTEARVFRCTACSKKSGPAPKIVQVQLPYAGKLLFQELMSMLIAPKFEF